MEKIHSGSRLLLWGSLAVAAAAYVINYAAGNEVNRQNEIAKSEGPKAVK